MTGPIQAVGQRAMLCHQLPGPGQIVILLILLFQGMAPEGAFLVVATPEGEDHRQGDLALEETVSDRLAELFLLFRFRPFPFREVNHTRRILMSIS